MTSQAACEVTVRINARLQPLDRGELLEDPLDETLRTSGCGAVTGAGTQLDENHEICFVDLQVELEDFESGAALVCETLDRLGAPKGTVVFDPSAPVAARRYCGVSDGVAVYLDGAGLPDDVYANCDVNEVYAAFEQLLGDEGNVWSYWQGPTETALYVYGRDAETIRSRLAPFIDSYPLCRHARVVTLPDELPHELAGLGE